MEESMAATPKRTYPLRFELLERADTLEAELREQRKALRAGALTAAQIAVFVLTVSVGAYEVHGRPGPVVVALLLLALLGALGWSAFGTDVEDYLELRSEERALRARADLLAASAHPRPEPMGPE